MWTISSYILKWKTKYSCILFNDFLFIAAFIRIALRIFVFYIVISSTISSLTYFSFTDLPHAAVL